MSNGRLIDPTPETLFAHDPWGKRDVERMTEIHEGIVVSLTPSDWELPGTLTLETLAVFGEFIADQIEASRQIVAMNEPDESATGIEEKRIFQDKLPTLAGKLIFPPVGWIDHQSHLLGPIANATEGRLTLIARWFDLLRDHCRAFQSGLQRLVPGSLRFPFLLSIAQLLLLTVDIRPLTVRIGIV